MADGERHQVADLPFDALFDAAPTPLLVVAPPHWTIVAANQERLRVTETTREQQIGMPLFDVFPDDPDDPDADGVRNLSASLERVMRSGVPDVMNVQRYALRDTDDLFVGRRPHASPRASRIEKDCSPVGTRGAMPVGWASDIAARSSPVKMVRNTQFSKTTTTTN